MSNDSLDQAIEQFGKAWVDRSPTVLMNLIASEDLAYYETAFDPPTTDWQRVKDLWDIVPKNQQDVTWQHEILVSDGTKAAVHVQVTRTMLPSRQNQDIDAVFIFGVNSSGKINYFRQWRAVR